LGEKEKKDFGVYHKEEKGKEVERVGEQQKGKRKISVFRGQDDWSVHSRAYAITSFPERLRKNIVSGIL
jgi:ribosomal protein S4